MENRPQPCCSGYQRTSSVMTSPSSLNWGGQTWWVFNDPNRCQDQKIVCWVAFLYHPECFQRCSSQRRLLKLTVSSCCLSGVREENFTTPRLWYFPAVVLINRSDDKSTFWSSKLKAISELSSCRWTAPESEETLVVCSSRRFQICTDALQLSADIWCFCGHKPKYWTCRPDDTSEHHQLCHLHVALGHFVILKFFDELCSRSANIKCWHTDTLNLK